jgi:hypothetical protein
MQVKTQPFKEALELKGEGISFDVYGNGSKRLGDLCVTKAGLIWSKGPNARASRDGGINVKWEEFIDWVQSRRAASGKIGGKLNTQAFAAMKASGQASGQGAKAMPGARGAATKSSAMGNSARGTASKPTSVSSPSSATRTLSGKAPSEAGKQAAKRASAMKLAANAAKSAASKAATQQASPASKTAPQMAKPSQSSKPGSAAMIKQAKTKMPTALSRKSAMPATGSKTSSAARRKAN